MGGESENAGQLNYAGVWLGERYLLKDLRAQGGLCAVYRGEDTVLRRPVAVKIVPAQWDAAYRAALRATATLAHPAAITPYDALDQDGQLFLTQEYLVAQPLSGYLREGAPIRRALDLAAQVARALAYAHRRDILHGDLTPAAVLVDKRATARVNNFGLPPDHAYFEALALAVARSEQTTPAAALYAATPYADSASGDPDDAPTLAAQRVGVTPLGPWGHGQPEGDVWAAGLLLWLLVTVPVVDDAAPTVGSAANEPGLAGSRAFRPETPQELRALVRRCILPGHPQRIADADTLVIALEDLTHTLELERPQPAAPTPRALVAAHAAARREADRARRAALAHVNGAWSPDAPTDPLPYEPFDAGATRAATDFAASDVGVGGMGGVGGYAAPSPPRPLAPPAPTGQRLRLPSRPNPATDAYPASDGRRTSFSAPTAPDRPAWGASTHEGYPQSVLLGGRNVTAEPGEYGPTARRRAIPDSPYAPYRPYTGRTADAGVAPGARRGLGLGVWLIIGAIVFALFFVVGYLLPPLTSLFH